MTKKNKIYRIKYNSDNNLIENQILLLSNFFVVLQFTPVLLRRRYSARLKTGRSKEEEGEEGNCTRPYLPLGDPLCPLSVSIM